MFYPCVEIDLVKYENVLQHIKYFFILFLNFKIKFSKNIFKFFFTIPKISMDTVKLFYKRIQIASKQ